ncbi:MAG: glycosyltransferase [Candidatus Acidiferrales bacterium]
MNITVILCSYNRCQSLAKALDSVAAMTVPASIDWEVLVVDNNSTDKTRETVEEFRRQHPQRFRYLFVAEPGKSHALNAGIREAHGDILVFTDDDVTVQPAWLHNLTSPLQDLGLSGAGGRTLPEQAASMPRWLSTDVRAVWAPLAVFDLGSIGCEISQTPYGNNMAFRRQMFDKHGGFRTDLGPRPGNDIRSEDTEFGQRLLRAGERLWYEPSAVVYHAVPASRLRKAYFQKWWFAKGRADVRESGVAPSTKWRAFGIPLVLFRRLTLWVLLWMFDVNPPRRFSSKTKVYWLAGLIVESFRQSRV